MLFFQTVLVYSLLFFLLYFLAKSKGPASEMMMVCLYAIVFGFRYGVGNDFFQYDDYFTAVNSGYYDAGDQWEVGYYYLNYCIAWLSGSNILFMMITSAIPFSIMVHYINKESRILLPFFVISYMMTNEWLLMSNVIRQSVAIGFWVGAIFCISRKQLLISVFFILLAFSMHRSAIVLLMLIPILWRNKPIFHNLYFELSLLIISLILMQVGVFQAQLSQIDILLELTDNTYYSDSNQSNSLYDDSVHIGIGFAIKLLRYILLIYLSNKVRNWTASRSYTLFYDLFFIGVLLSFVFFGSRLFLRFNSYFMICEVFVAANTLYYIIKKKKQIYWVVVLCFFVTNFIACLNSAESNTAMYVFRGQTDYYHLKQSLR